MGEREEGSKLRQHSLKRLMGLKATSMVTRRINHNRERERGLETRQVGFSPGRWGRQTGCTCRGIACRDPALRPSK